MATTNPVLGSKHYTVDDSGAVQEFFHSRGWTDGLPVVPPTPDAVRACLEWVGLPPDHLVGVEPVRERAITAEKLAVNAVLAGCLPMHFPVVVASFTAMLEEPFPGRHQQIPMRRQATTLGPRHLLFHRHDVHLRSPDA